MFTKIHFIAGLPRSGSTLLSALLRQNPRFHAGVTSPLNMLCNAVLEKMGGSTEFATCFDEGRRLAVLRHVFAGYYANLPDVAVLFDTNRLWTARAGLLKQLFPDSTLICCVRPIGWIIDSVERALRRNPARPSRIFGYKSGSSIYERVEQMMNSDSGLIGLPWSALREAWFSENAGRLIIIDYDALASRPLEVLEKLYQRLGEPSFPHRLTGLAYAEPDYDDILGMPGMHSVRDTVGKERREPVIPPDIFNRYADTEFWGMPDHARRGITLISAAPGSQIFHR